MDGARIEDFTGVLRYLRGLGAPCEPPVGVGSFLLLYASEREVVVWYSPAKENQREGEVAIPCGRIARAWEALVAGDPLDEPALEEYGEGPGGGRWLMALLAQIPGVAVRLEPLALAWSPEDALAPKAEESAPPAEAARKSRKRVKSRRVVAPAAVERGTAERSA